MSVEKTIFLCPMCRRQFDRKKSLNSHCCSSVQFEPPIKKSDGKKRHKGINSQAKSAERKGGKRDGWSQEEESLLETGVMEFGNNWTLILYKYGSSFRMEHQHPTILSAKWDGILKKRDSDTKPFPLIATVPKNVPLRQAPENDENDNEEPSEAAASPWPDSSATSPFPDSSAASPWPDSSASSETHSKPVVIVESVDSKPVVVSESDAKPVVTEEEGGAAATAAAAGHYKPMVIVTPQNKDRKRRSADHDDEDYVPELGADSDSDCSDVNKQEYEQDDEEEEEEEEYESEEEEEGQLTEKSFAAEILPITLTENSSNASYIAVPKQQQQQQQQRETPSFSIYLNDPNSLSTSSSSPSFALPVCAVQPQAGNPSSSIVEASIVEAAAAAAGLSADDNPATPTPGATYYQLLTEEGGTTAYAIPVSAIDPASSGHDHVIIEAASSSSTLPPPLPLPPPTILPQPFQNLINSEDYQRLLQFPIDEVLTDRTHGNELFQAVLSELARIMASVYPGHRSVAAASKFSDSVCVPWLRTFLPHLCSLPETREVTFAGQEESRPVLSAIKAKVKTIFLFYLNVMPTTIIGNQ